MDPYLEIALEVGAEDVIVTNEEGPDSPPIMKVHVDGVIRIIDMTPKIHLHPPSTSNKWLIS